MALMCRNCWNPAPPIMQMAGIKYSISKLYIPPEQPRSSRYLSILLTSCLQSKEQCLNIANYPLVRCELPTLLGILQILPSDLIFRKIHNIMLYFSYLRQ